MPHVCLDITEKIDEQSPGYIPMMRSANYQHTAYSKLEDKNKCQSSEKGMLALSICLSTQSN